MADNADVVRICSKADVSPGSVKAFTVGANALAVYNIEGTYYVTDDECTHAAASLADGMLEGDVRSAAGRGTKEKPVIAPPAPRLTSAVACCHQGLPADGTGSPPSFGRDGAGRAGRARQRGRITLTAANRADA